MHEQYGLKKSPALRICKVLALMLFLTFIASFFLMFVGESILDELNGSGKLTEERKEELLSYSTFKIAVRLGYEIKNNPKTYGSISEIKSITYLTSTTRTSYGFTNTQTFLRVERKRGDDLYFKYYKGFELTTSEVYSNYSKSNETNQFTTTETFKSAETNYIKELLVREDIADLIYDFKKDEVTSKRYWNVLLKIEFSSIREHYGNISKIYIGSQYTDDRAKQNAVIKVVLEDGNEFFYIIINNIFAITDSSAYYLRNSNEVCFDRYDLEVLYKEVGYTWQ